MNYIDDLIMTRGIIEQVATQVEPLVITVESLSRGVKPFEGHYFYGLSIKESEPLKKLHNSLVDVLPNVPVEKPDSTYFLPESNGRIVQQSMTMWDRLKRIIVKRTILLISRLEQVMKTHCRLIMYR